MISTILISTSLREILYFTTSDKKDQAIINKYGKYALQEKLKNIPTCHRKRKNIQRRRQRNLNLNRYPRFLRFGWKIILSFSEVLATYWRDCIVLNLMKVTLVPALRNAIWKCMAPKIWKYRPWGNFRRKRQCLSWNLIWSGRKILKEVGRESSSCDCC